MTENPTLSRSQRFAVAVVGRLPSAIIRDTERVMLNAATGVVGFTSLIALGEPGTIAKVLPLPLLVAWSVMLMAGALLTLVGIFRSLRLTERAGMTLTGLGCLVYASALFTEGSARGQIIGGLFLAIAATKALRLLVSTAGGAIAARGVQ